MQDKFAQEIDFAIKQPHGAVLFSHLSQQIQEMNKLYDNEPTRDAALLLCTDWLESGSDLRKAAARRWAAEKGIAGENDRPDPTAAQPAPSDLSNGQDAPPTGATAEAPDRHSSGAGNTDNAEHPGAKPGEAAPSAKHKGGGKGKSVADRLRALKAARDARKGAPATAPGAAYDQGYRDATKRHADHAHRISQVTARHAFAMGAKVAAARLSQDAEAANGVRQEVIPVQTNMTQQPVQKASFEVELQKAFSVTQQPPAHPSYLRSLGGSVAEGAPGAALAYFAARRGHMGLARAGMLAATGGYFHGGYASFRNQAKQAGFKKPRLAALHASAGRYLGESVGGGPLGGAIGTHLVGFGSGARVQKADLQATLSKAFDAATKRRGSR